jgi:hypothetical protein
MAAMTIDLPTRSNLRSTLALFAVAALAACGSNPPTPAPDAPLGVSAIAGDKAVIVSWEASAGATGYRVYFNSDASGAVAISTSIALDAGTALFVSVSGLVDGTKYRFAVAARGLSGEGALSAEVTATPAANVPISVASTVPADAAIAVSRTTPIAVTFNRAASTASINGQAVSGACSGSLQLSSDDFNSCVGFSGAPVASSANQTFTFALTSPLTPGATYRLRVTTAAKDANGIALAQAFTLAHGFSTANALTVSSLSPADGAMLVALNTKVTVNFSAPITTSTATGNTADTACSGSLQLSIDTFATCLKLASLNVSAQSAVLATAAPLPPGTLVQARVTIALLDAGGNPLSSKFTSAGFTTVPPLTIASVNPDGAGSSNVDFLPTLQVAFAAPAAANSVTTNLGTSTSCSGSLQLSKASDAFASNTCVPMAAQPASTDGGTTFAVTPAARLASNTKYLIRITTAATDMTGTPLAAAFTSSGFTTRPFAVVSISPADGAQNLSRKQGFTITFNRPVNSSSLGTGTCSDPINLVKAGGTACAAHSVATASGATVTLTPSPYLDASATYQLTINAQALLDDSGGKLVANYSTTTGYTTQAAATPTLTPANGAPSVALNTKLQLAFNIPVDPSTVIVATAAAPACGTVSLTRSATCTQFAGQPTTLDNKTFTLTLAAPLVASSQYTFASSASVLDSTGVPAVAASVSFTTGSLSDTTPPGEVTSLQATPALQSISLSWVNPSDADFSRVRIHHCSNSASCSKSDPVLSEVPGSAGAAGSTLLSGLTPGTSYELWLTTVDQSGNESSGSANTATTQVTAFSGNQAGAQPDFTSAQKAAAVGVGVNQDTVSVWFTWTSSMLYLGVGNSVGTSLLTANQDVLWVAIDTDPDTDQTGEWRTPSLGNNEVIWPFKADTIVEFIPNGLASAVVSRPAATPCALIHPNANPVASDCTAVSGAATFDGASGTENGLSEVGIPLSVLGATAPARLRFAVAVLNSKNGYAYALAPKNSAAIDVLGYFGSVTSSFNPGANVTGGTHADTSVASSPLSLAAGLVKIAALIPVPASTTSTPNSGAVKGSLHPLSYTLSDTQAALRDDGTGGDATAGDGIWTGVYNFGGSTQELFFKLDDGAGSDEFSSGTDRVWTLSGAPEALPQLSFNAVYSKNHTFQLTFAVTNPQGTTNMKEVVGNSGEIGNFTPGMGALFDMPASGSTTWITSPVTFMNHDFTAASLQWKARDNGSNTWESDSGGAVSNHQMNDDVINKRTLTWTWNDYSHDPF